jgi:hypothetical protein
MHGSQPQEPTIVFVPGFTLHVSRPQWLKLHVPQAELRERLVFRQEGWRRIRVFPPKNIKLASIGVAKAQDNSQDIRFYRLFTRPPTAFVHWRELTTGFEVLMEVPELEPIPKPAGEAMSPSDFNELVRRLGVVE